MAGHRKFKVNEGYFDNLGRDQSYILGYFWGDGCVTKHRGVRNRVVLMGGPEDKEHLENMALCMGATYPVLKEGSTWKLEMSSQVLADRLFYLGIVPKRGKSVPEGIDKQSFIRGFLDSDGCVIKKPKFRIGFANKDLVIVNWVRSELYDLGKVVLQNHPDTDVWAIWYGGNTARKVMDFIRPGEGELCLARKWA